MTRGGLAWPAVAALLAACALVGWRLPREAIDWQPTLAWSQPWRALGAVGVHYSTAHLVVNLGGVLLAAALGLAARVPPRMAWAWLAAWPLTHLGLLSRPDLAHYGGLSGVLHAGVAIVVTYLLLTGTRAQRVVAGVVLAGLVVKLLGEAPWGAALRHDTGWRIAIAPLAHTTGAIAGAACAAIALRWPRPTPSTTTHA